MSDNVKEIDVWRFAFKLFLFGFCLIFVGMILMIVANVFSDGSASFGGIIIVGPIPIAFGGGENAWFAILLGTVLTIVSIMLFLLVIRRIDRQ